MQFMQHMQLGLKRCLLPVLAAITLMLGPLALALPEGQVNVNTAPVEELARVLDGVGQSRAQAIVEYREQYGEFTSVEDLMDVRGIGPSVVETNKERIAFKD